MTRTLSTYLDLCRLGAALTVVLSHVRLMDVGGRFWQAARLGPEAVPVFFVLSGFVIAYVTSTRERDLASYALSRTSRLYSVLIPVLAAVAILDACSALLDPAFTAPKIVGHSVFALPATLMFVNDAWGSDLAFGTDLPLWSLSVEASYYVAFAAFSFGRTPAVRFGGPLMVAAVMGPKAVFMAPLWIGGFALYRACPRMSLRVAAFCFGAGCAVFLAYQVWAGTLGVDTAGPQARPDLPQDYISGGAFTLTLLAVSSCPGLLERPLGLIARPVRWAAGGSFTLYLLHYPSMIAIGALLGHTRRHTPIGTALIVAGSIGLSYLIAEISERRKAWWRRAILRAFPAMRVSRTRAA